MVGYKFIACFFILHFKAEKIKFKFLSLRKQIKSQHNRKYISW